MQTQAIASNSATISSQQHNARRNIKPQARKHKPLSVPGRALELVDIVTKQNKTTRNMSDDEALLKAAKYVIYLLENTTDDVALTDALRATLIADVRALLPKQPETERRNQPARVPADYWTVRTAPREQDVKVADTSNLSKEEQAARAAEKKAKRIHRAEASAQASKDTSKSIFEDPRARKQEGKSRAAKKAEKQAAEGKKK